MRARLAASLIGVGLAAGTAEAKYDRCVPGGAVTLTADPMPTNGKVWVSAGQLPPGPLRLRGAGTDRIVAYDPRTHTIDVGALEPDTDYSLVATDIDFVWATFSTSSTADRGPPRPPVIRGLALRHAVDAPDHEYPRWLPDDPYLPAAAIELDVDLSDDTAFVDVEVTDASGQPVLSETTWRDDLPLLGLSRCGPALRLPLGATGCVTIRAVDLAGNRSAPATGCGTVELAIAGPERTFTPLRRFWRAAPPVRAQAWRLWLSLGVATLWLMLRRRDHAPIAQ